jgi:hypothetical protein
VQDRRFGELSDVLVVQGKKVHGSERLGVGRPTNGALFFKQLLQEQYARVPLTDFLVGYGQIAY